MTIEQILEILENYKLRIPPTVFYELKADIVNAGDTRDCENCKHHKANGCERWECEFEQKGMTREEAIAILNHNVSACLHGTEWGEALDMAIKALEQEPATKNDLGVDLISRVDAINAVSEALKHTFVEHEDVANKIIGNLPSVTPQEPFINKPCVSSGVCEHDKQKVLDKIRAEIEKLQKMCDKNDLNLMAQYSAFGMVLDILDKYKAESEADNG